MRAGTSIKVRTALVIAMLPRRSRSIASIGGPRRTAIRGGAVPRGRDPDLDLAFSGAIEAPEAFARWRLLNTELERLRSCPRDGAVLQLGELAYAQFVVR
jgi:hypothetical protein